MNKNVNDYIIENYKEHKVKALNKKIIDRKIKSFTKASIGEVRNENINVNLTSFPERMTDIKYTIYSLLSQTFVPNKVILWLSVKEFPNRIKDLPEEVIKFTKLGLTIEFISGENLRVYNKLIHGLKNYPSVINVTADDDIYYHRNWLEGLYQDYKCFGDNYIYAYRVHQIVFKNDNLYKYAKWKKAVKAKSPSFLNFLTGVGGVLYPANIFNKEVLKKEQFLNLSPRADDVWYWAMAVLNNIRTKIVPGFEGLVYVNPERELRLSGEKTLAAENVKLGGNDLQIRQVLANYQILEKLQQEFKNLSNTR